MTRRTMGTRYVSDWRDHTSTARRQHIHGPLQSLEADGKPYRFELFLCAGMILATVSVITWSAMQ